MLLYLKALPYIIYLTIIQWLETKLVYRTFRGGKWYYICDIDTGEEYWTRTCPGQDYALLITQEDWT